jgi:GT2 family glycosyltransferase
MIAIPILETSVIIPNWNGENLLKVCLSSLRRQTYRDFELIVVDNGSFDGSVELIESHFREVKLISLPVNKGFSQAVNIGIKAAAGKYIALLNNDTEAEPDWLRELTGALARNPEVGFCASKMMNYFQRNIIDSAGDSLQLYGSNNKNGEVDSNLNEKPGLIFSACAGAAIYRREMLLDTGLFDEDFFAYYEDVDLGFRAQLLGYKCLFVPTAVVYHIHQATSDRMPAKRFVFIQRNIVFVHLKNMPARILLKMLPAFFVNHIFVSITYFLKTKDIKPVLSVYLHILKGIPATLKKRKAIKNRRMVSPSYIKSITGPFPSLVNVLIKRLKKC